MRLIPSRRDHIVRFCFVELIGVPQSMTTSIHVEEAAVIRKAARDMSDLDPLVAMAGDAQFVLIGEASHGTHEFYETRAELTRRLIEEKGFGIIALEADWPDTLRAHRYVTGQSEDRDAASALGDFARFPSWMWRNTVMVEFLEWLREHNRSSV